jgi:four helix bundle protein
MDKFAHDIYRLTLGFPKSEIFGIVSQIRRAALSVVLNFIEGFARQKSAVKRNFWEISYGSLKESKYLLDFSCKEKYISEKEYKDLIMLADEIGAMLWKCLQSLK